MSACDDDCDVDDGWRLETADDAAEDGGEEEGRETLAGWRRGLMSLLGVEGGDGACTRDWWSSAE